MPPATSARARVRAELTREICEAARDELAVAGPADLSLRAVARRVDMVPSALYRYFASRDHLLTALIVDAYRSLGLAMAAADGACAAGDHLARWVGTGRAARDWSAGRPHEWALVFGSPVPEYHAPDETTAAAFTVHQVPLGIVIDAHRAGTLAPPVAGPGPDRVVGAAIRPVIDQLAPDVPARTALAALAAWTAVLGAISLERFGHYTGAVLDLDAYFDQTLALTAALFGLTRPPAPGRSRPRR